MGWNYSNSCVDGVQLYLSYILILPDKIYSQFSELEVMNMVVVDEIGRFYVDVW